MDAHVRVIAALLHADAKAEGMPMATLGEIELSYTVPTTAMGNARRNDRNVARLALFCGSLAV